MRGSATSTSASPGSVYADRVFRSPMGVFGGVLLLIFGVWLGGDAVLNGPGRSPWVAVFGLLLGAPLVAAFTLYPAVFINNDRIRVRNPYRTIIIPWTRVEDVRAKYSTEVTADGSVYQLWAIPVSMRARKRADRRSTRTVEPDGPPGLFGRTRTRTVALPEEPVLAAVDQAVTDLLAMKERHGGEEASAAARGEVTVRWTWQLFAPALLGLIGLIVVNVV